MEVKWTIIKIIHNTTKGIRNKYKFVVSRLEKLLSFLEQY